MKKIFIVGGICVALLIINYFQLGCNTAPGDPRGNLYAGSKSCIKCHGGIYNSYLHTAHFIASIPADENTVHGDFTKGFNEFYVNDKQKVVMEKLDSGLYQTYYLNGKVKQRSRFDVVFGGVKGESYLMWKGNELFQLPLSYYSQLHKWSTSPGYGFDFLNYSRLRSIGIQCLECHASYINDLPPEDQQMAKGEKFDKSTIVYSIDCERCHGPGATHVAFHTDSPGIKTARFMTRYKSLNRGQRLDMCAQCHSGKPQVKIRSTFEFLPGDTLAKYKLAEYSKPVDTSYLDVHGNQLQLLQCSKCFRFSTMDCATCHNVHQNTRGNDVLYAQKCLTCHNTPNQVHCKMTNRMSAALLQQKCIGCHMPALPTKVISVQVSDKLPSVQFFVHTHHIAVYPKEVQKIMAYLNNK